jgi:hypothetical protein
MEVLEDRYQAARRVFFRRWEANFECLQLPLVKTFGAGLVSRHLRVRRYQPSRRAWKERRLGSQELPAQFFLTQWTGGQPFLAL